MNLEDKLILHYFQEVLSKLKPSNISSLQIYSDTFSSYLNLYLVKNRDDNALYNHHISLIRNSIKLSKSPFPMTIYHGTSTNILGQKDFRDYKEPYIDIKSLLSCSIDKEKSLSFATRTNYKKGIVLEINIPQGYPALWMGCLSIHPSEKEVLLLNNTRLVIVDAKEEQASDNVSYTLIQTVPKLK